MVNVKIILIVLITVFGCSKIKPGRSRQKLLSEDSLERISYAWQQDSSRCLRNRDPVKMKFVIEQVGLIGKDTKSIIRYLGRPNYVLIHKGIKTYAYFLECYEKNNDELYDIICIQKAKKGKVAGDHRAQESAQTISVPGIPMTLGLHLDIPKLTSSPDEQRKN